MLKPTFCFQFAFIFTAVALSSALNARDWPALRGADGCGTLTTNGILSRTSDVELKTRWKKTLGSGYSSVIVADQKVVAMYSAETEDRIICLSASDGSTLWEFPIGPRFKGENGSFDGPLSTPVIHDSRIYALSPTGRLVCVSLADGEQIWSKEMVKDFGAKKPLYGFVTSPIVTNDTLIVQTGVSDKSVAGLNTATGEIKWTAGDDLVSSQSPAVVSLFGRDIVLAHGAKKLTGIDATNGELLFEFAHGGGNGGAVMPVAIGEAQILLTLDDSFSKAVALRQVDQKIEVSEEWQNRSIKNTYNIPSLSNGRVFAYSTRVLTCVDPETGRPYWKSRTPGDGFLITIDDHLIINTKQGSLHLAKASKSGYEEVSHIDLFKDLVWSVPAYSDDSVFARSLGEIARIDIVPAATGTTLAQTDALPVGPAFSKLLQDVDAQESNAEKTKLVDAWFDGQTEFPVIEDDIVHFVYRGIEKDVAIAGDMFGARQERKMVPLAGTDLFYYSMRLPMDQRANYAFLINFKPQIDKLNSRKMTSSMYAGEMEFAVRLRNDDPLAMSWFSMSDWKQPEYLDSMPENLRGTLAKRTLKSKIMDSEIEFQVYTPPGYEEAGSENRFPVAYVLDGPNALKLGQMAAAIDNSDFHDTIVVFLEAGGGPKFTEAIAEEIVPFVDAQFRTRADRNSRLLIGFGFMGGGALVTGATKNDLFGGIASQSPLAFAAEEKMIQKSFSEIKQPTKVHLQWGRFDMYNPHENWDLRTSSENIFNAISKNENVTVLGGVVNDSTDWSSWKNRYGEIFSLLSD